MVDGEEAYRVNHLMDSRCRGGRLQYLVDWEGYGPEERAWVNKENIPTTFSLEFLSAHSDRLASRPRGRPRRLAFPRVQSRSQGGSVTVEVSAARHQRELSPEF